MPRTRATPPSQPPAGQPRHATMRAGAGTLAALALASLVLGGCAFSPSAPTITYDLGPSAGAAPGSTPLPRLRVAQTDGPSWLDGNGLYYRLHYAQAERLQPYATQRWVMSPVRLFDERLREAVASRGALTWYGDTAAPALKVDMLEFEQVFDSASASRAVIRVRATVFRSGLIGQKTFVAEQPAPTADGAGGVKALAAASDAIIAAILDWAATLPLQQ
ncbi:ABC-type transport auxiliary lipoprotein family protein [Cupriavidus sp. 30B13]|uniref:ABC-type transport auxiliary lipoprotein family protein n=1 Tax=Cupriavidus sp. 30B13 TaxID=3384241 RepID=UPI003B913553